MTSQRVLDETQLLNNIIQEITNANHEQITQDSARALDEICSMPDTLELDRPFNDLLFETATSILNELKKYKPSIKLANNANYVQYFDTNKIQISLYDNIDKWGDDILNGKLNFDIGGPVPLKDIVLPEASNIAKLMLEYYALNKPTYEQYKLLMDILAFYSYKYYWTLYYIKKLLQRVLAAKSGGKYITKKNIITDSVLNLMKLVLKSSKTKISLNMASVFMPPSQYSEEQNLSNNIALKILSICLIRDPAERSKIIRSITPLDDMMFADPLQDTLKMQSSQNPSYSHLFAQTTPSYSIGTSQASKQLYNSLYSRNDASSSSSPHRQSIKSSSSPKLQHYSTSITYTEPSITPVPPRNKDKTTLKQHNTSNKNYGIIGINRDDRPNSNFLLCLIILISGCLTLFIFMNTRVLASKHYKQNKLLSARAL